MVKMIGTGLAMFGALFIADLLMKIVGNPLLSSVPSETKGTDWFAAAATWLVTSEAMFWWLAAVVLLLAVFAWRSSWMTQFSSVVSTTTLSAGVAAGAAYRLTHPDMFITDLASDPAFWLLVAGVLAPFVLWGLRRALYVAIVAIFEGFDKQQEQRANSQLLPRQELPAGQS